MNSNTSVSDREAFDALVGEGDKKWKKVDTSSSGESWKPTKGESLTGVFTGKTKMVTTKYGDKKLYLLEKQDGTTIDVWESSQLKRAFSQLTAGQEIKITFNGKVLPDKGQAYNDYTVEIAE